MRFTSSIFLALAGSTLAQVSTIESDFNDIKSSVASLTTTLQQYDGTTAGALKLINAVTALDNQIDKTNTDAQALGTVSESDQYSVLTAANGLYPGIIQALNAYVPAYAKLPTGYPAAAQQQVAGIKQKTDALAQTLIDKATGTYQDDAKALASAIDAAFASVLQKPPQTPTSTSLPTPPQPSGGSGGPNTSSSASSPPTSASIGSAPVYSVSTKIGVSSASLPTPAVYSTSPGVYVPPPITSTPLAPAYTGAAALNKVPLVQVAALVVAAAAL